MQTHQPSELEHEPQTAFAETDQPRIATAQPTTVEPEPPRDTIEAVPEPTSAAATALELPPAEQSAEAPIVLEATASELAGDKSTQDGAEEATDSSAAPSATSTDVQDVPPEANEPLEAIMNDSEAVTEQVEAAVGLAPEADQPVMVAEPPAVSAAESASEPATETVETHDEAAPADGREHPLFTEVTAAPHKVYLLGRVRKAIATAGESDLTVRLRELEADILAQVSVRTAAKEALCERAEALKDSTAWKATGDAFKALFEEWKQVGAAGRELDDQLWARFNLARGAFNERRAKHFAEREQVWSANREQKEALCVEAEALSDSTNWKATAEAIRDLQARWKAVGSAGREKDEALWARFNTAKQRFFDRRTAAWAENRKRKEALVADAEALKDSTDWRTAGDALKAMQAEWKTIGPAGREHEDELWTRFRAATQTFFDRRSSVFAERTKSEQENLAKKLELCQRAEALVYTGDALSAAREAKDLQAQWKEIGPVPREQSEAIWARFREACDKIFANAAGERDRQQNEWHTRMREAMARKREQLNSLRESITHDEANIERWRESLSSLKPGGKSEEIGKGLEDKIIDVMARIREKQARVDDLRSSINDIEAKLKE